MERQYFDNILLAQFYVTKMPVTVYVDGNLLKIVDADDITDPYIGNGMLPSGEMHPFDYRDVEFIMIGKNKYTIEDVNKAFAAKDQPKAETEPKEEPAEEETPEGEEETEPKESIKRGRNMAKTITEKLGFSQVSEPYTIQTGDMVHNVNPQCNHFGSKGIANGVFDEDGITMIRYTVTNQGDTFKPGDVLTKSMDQMNVMDMGDTDFDMSGEEEMFDDYTSEDDDDFVGFGDDEGMFDDEAWDEENWDEEEDFEDEEYEEEEDFGVYDDDDDEEEDEF